MRPLAAMLTLFLTTGLASAQPVHPAAAPHAKADPPAYQLGRAKPDQNYDSGDYRVVVEQVGGPKKLYPRLGKHADVAKLAAGLPDSCNWAAKAGDVLGRMYVNDQLGCCVISSLTHGLGFMTASDTGRGVLATDAEIRSMYFTWCGGGDNGCYMSAVSDYHQKVGVLASGKRYKSRGSAAVDHANRDLVKSAIYYGGGVRVGFSVPADWMSTPDGGTWDVSSRGTVGGHEVYAYGYTSQGVLVSTWGGHRLMTWAAFTSPRWVDEVYITLSPDWYGSDGLAPNGIDVKGLEAAFAAISGGNIPDPVPDPTPPPPGPGPGKGFTGTIATTTAETVTTTYKDGVKQPNPTRVVVESAVVTAAGGVQDAELREVSPAAIAAFLKLVADVKAGAPREQIAADVVALLLALSSRADPIPQQMPARRPDPAPMQLAP